jgi:hypothetical protein
LRAQLREGRRPCAMRRARAPRAGQVRRWRSVREMRAARASLGAPLRERRRSRAEQP